MPKTVILSAARTPIGKMGGGLAPLDATELGGTAIKCALERADVAPEQVEHVIMGQVLQAGQGQIPSRQAQIKAGIPREVSSETINKVCASGIRAAGLLDAAIRAGDIEVAVGGGMESMSKAPYLLKEARFGFRMGDGKAIDEMIHDGLTNPFSGKHMAQEASEVAAELEMTRADMDRWALRSHELALKATDEGRLPDEIVAVTVKGKKGDTVVEVDEGPRRDTSLEVLSKLPPIFMKDGTHTPGNAPGVNDGGGALVLSSGAGWAAAAAARAARPSVRAEGRGPRSSSTSQARVESQHRSAAFFDLDRTLMAGSSAFEFARAAARAGLMSRRELAGDALANLAFRLKGSTDASTDAVRERIGQALAGVRQRDLLRLGPDMLAGILPRVYPQMLRTAYEHQDAGRRVYICTAASAELADVLAGVLRFDGAVGTRPEVVDGIYTGRIDGPF